MKTLYLECRMGAAGDMLTAALMELLDRPEEFLEKMAALGLPGVQVSAEKAQQCGITGTHVHVLVNGQEECSEDLPHVHVHPHVHEHDHDHVHPHEHEHTHEHEHDHDHEHDHEHTHEHDHEHTHDHVHPHDHDHGHGHGHGHHHHHSHFSLGDVEKLIQGLALPEQVKADALAVYLQIAQAESHAHNMPVDQVHFHEVGSLDAVADVVGCCLLIHMLGVEEIQASPIHVGAGSVRCAHGILPVPAPATAFLLQGVPIYGGQVEGELCTPTGAALLKHFVRRFGPMPPMTVEKVGYGMGSKTFEQANCLRAFLGQTDSAPLEEISELSCNLDDMTAEDLGYAQEKLLAQGARDVFLTSIQMKKGRPGVLFTCICLPEEEGKFIQLILQHTSTRGVRIRRCSRAVLDQTLETVETAYGPVQVKRSRGYGVERVKAEYEDLRRIAEDRGLPLETVRRQVERAL